MDGNGDPMTKDMADILTAQLEAMTKERDEWRAEAAHHFASVTHLQQQLADAKTHVKEVEEHLTVALDTIDKQGADNGYIKRALETVKSERDTLTAHLAQMGEALKRLAVLGRGRSEGNCIAQEALRPPSPIPAAEKEVDIQRFEQSPCYLCGYAGGGYYQPKTHSCATLYHAAAEKEGGG